MVLGVVIILLACVLNVMLLAIPLVLLVWFADWATDLMKKLHWIGPRGADVVYLAILVFTILMAACIQLWVWGLAPRAEPGRWILAVSAFAIGEACLVFVGYKWDTSQHHRRFRSWISASRVCGFTFVCLLAYTSVTLHGVLAALPGRVLHFVVGGGS